MIKMLSLPAPVFGDDDLIVPNSIVYIISVVYTPDNITQSYNVKLYDGICVVQNISITPEFKEINPYVN